MEEFKQFLIKRIILILTDPVCLGLIILIVTMSILAKIYFKKHKEEQLLK